MRHATLVMDMQFGSTGKGSLVGYLTDKMRPDVAAAAWGPNAGHTFMDRHGRVFIHTMLPIAAICDSVKKVLLGPGSIINWDNLIKEVQEMNAQLEMPRHFELYVHPQAAMIYPRHLTAEKVNVRIGSTMKGTGAALIEKIQRDPGTSPLVRDCAPTAMLTYATRLHNLGVALIVDEGAYNEAVDDARHIMIEGAQGFSLGLHRHFWPYGTSREITPAQMLSDCALPVTQNISVYGTLRTFPIRVANRFDESGKQIGTSGPYYEDQHEIQWSDIGLEPELTTVTKLPRRVFTFSYNQLREAVRLCRPRSLFLNFCNYLGTDEKEQEQMVEAMCERIEIACTETARGNFDAPPVEYLGYGPSILDIKERK